MKTFKLKDIIKKYNETKEEKYYYLFGIYKYGSNFKTCEKCNKSIIYYTQ